MSANLSEFLKVFLIVITWSTCILGMRRYMLSLDEDEAEADVNQQKKVEPS